MSFLFAFWTMELDLTRPCSDCCPSPGLGTSTAQEAKEYFSDMARHRIPFKYSGPADDEAITLVITLYTCTDLQFLNSHSIHVFSVLFFFFSSCSASRPLVRRKWRRERIGSPASWSTDDSAGSITSPRSERPPLRPED